MAADGRLAKRRGQTVAPFMFCGIYLMQGEVFRDTPSEAFSSVVLFDAAEAAGKLFGLRHDGLWAQLNSPDGLAELSARLDD